MKASSVMQRALSFFIGHKAETSHKAQASSNEDQSLRINPQNAEEMTGPINGSSVNGINNSRDALVNSYLGRKKQVVVRSALKQSRMQLPLLASRRFSFSPPTRHPVWCPTY